MGFEKAVRVKKKLKVLLPRIDHFSGNPSSNDQFKTEGITPESLWVSPKKSKAKLKVLIPFGECGGPGETRKN